MHKVIFHFDQEEKINKLINNVNNLFNDFEEEGEELTVEILANGTGIHAFKKDALKNQQAINDLLKKGVKIALCHNSLSKSDFSKEDFIAETTQVKSGVGELTRKQNEGWAYIKP